MPLSAPFRLYLSIATFSRTSIATSPAASIAASYSIATSPAAGIAASYNSETFTHSYTNTQDRSLSPHSV